MGAGDGDRLARGNASASWGPLDVSQDKWEGIFGDEPEKKKKSRKGSRNGRGKKSDKHRQGK